MEKEFWSIYQQNMQKIIQNFEINKTSENSKFKIKKEEIDEEFDFNAGFE